ncbi:MAG: AGE family epimerase/isomerase [Lacibacter sp.]
MKQELLLRYKAEMRKELDDILSYWMKYTVDEVHGGFCGSVNNQNIADPDAAKGIVLHARILWSFSAAYRLAKQEEYFVFAQRAYHYISDFFFDHEFGGVYWSVEADGKLLDGKKQIYGLAFCIYGLAEYYKVCNDSSVLDKAIELYKLIEQYSFDEKKNGYIEAFTREWNEIADLRLSEKDNNERKTMNTHLHVIEAYANLFSVWPVDELKNRISNLLQLFDEHFINKNNYHLHLFFDDDWHSKSLLQSYGHDIEAAWLLQQCAEIINDEKWIKQFRLYAVPVADAAAEGLDKDGGLWYEYEPAENHLITEKHSWPQAEAMIGFFNAYRLSGHEKYLQYSLHSWEFVKKYIRDQEGGEWFWGVNKDYSLMEKDKAGFWKCPYHNSRACIELMKRI